MAVTLAGKKALITGANQGLGLEIARHYVRLPPIRKCSWNVLTWRVPPMSIGW